MFRKSLCLVPRMRRTLFPATKQPMRNIWDLSHPASEFRAIVKEMDRRMEEMERDMFKWSPFRSLAPQLVRIDGINPHNFSLDIDASGFKPEEIKLSLNSGKLRIEAAMDRTDENGNTLKQTLFQEFTVPSNLDLSSVKSILGNDGVVHITGNLKSELKDAKEIPIEGIKKEEGQKSLEN